jgi:hypothetical protein
MEGLEMLHSVREHQCLPPPEIAPQIETARRLRVQLLQPSWGFMYLFAVQGKWSEEWNGAIELSTPEAQSAARSHENLLISQHPVRLSRPGYLPLPHNFLSFLPSVQY